MLLIDKLSGKPVYEQIIEGVEKNILMGVYPEGGVLPSLRELSVTLGINPNTIQKSYAELIRRGVIIPALGSGTYVAPDAKEKIRKAAAEKLTVLEELVADLALADVPKGDVLATVCAVYARAGKGNTPAETAQPLVIPSHPLRRSSPGGGASDQASPCGGGGKPEGRDGEGNTAANQPQEGGKQS